MKLVPLVGCTAILATGCDRIPGTDAYLIAKAEHAAAEHLLDPSSAIFRAVRVRSVEGTKIICGLMNGRNEAGGFSQPVRFLTAGEGAEVDRGPSAAPARPPGSKMTMAAPQYDFQSAWDGAGCDEPAGAPKP